MSHTDAFRKRVQDEESCLCKAQGPACFFKSKVSGQVEKRGEDDGAEAGCREHQPQQDFRGQGSGFSPDGLRSHRGVLT